MLELVKCTPQKCLWRPDTPALGLSHERRSSHPLPRLVTCCLVVHAVAGLCQAKLLEAGKGHVDMPRDRLPLAVRSLTVGWAGPLRQLPLSGLCQVQIFVALGGVVSAHLGFVVVKPAMPVVDFGERWKQGGSQCLQV